MLKLLVFACFLVSFFSLSVILHPHWRASHLELPSRCAALGGGGRGDQVGGVGITLKKIDVCFTLTYFLLRHIGESYGFMIIILKTLSYLRGAYSEYLRLKTFLWPSHAAS